MWLLQERACSRLARCGLTVRPQRPHREQARSHRKSGTAAGAKTTVCLANLLHDTPAKPAYNPDFFRVC
ncbi:hypothetical protein EQV96_14770 [Pseudomonas sp. TMW22080]|nr:hypothetical protein [Pseudomonas sp. TMW22080]